MQGGSESRTSSLEIYNSSRFFHGVKRGGEREMVSLPIISFQEKNDDIFSPLERQSYILDTIFTSGVGTKLRNQHFIIKNTT